MITTGNKFAIAFATVLFAACNTANNAKTNSSANSATTQEVAVRRDTIPDIKTWTGTVKGNIPVFVWFTIKDSVLVGELTYLNTKDRKPIKIIGNLLPSMCMFSEYTDSGLITGMWSGKLNEIGFTGRWYATQSNKEYPFELRHKDTNINKAPSLTAQVVEGTYKYEFRGAGGTGTGEVSIKQLNKTHIVFNAFSVTATHGQHIAEIDDDTLVLTDNLARYNKHNEDYSCEFTIRFFKDFLVIQTKEGSAECGFGNGAGVDGVFIKSSSTFTASTSH